MGRTSLAERSEIRAALDRHVREWRAGPNPAWHTVVQEWATKIDVDSEPPKGGPAIFPPVLNSEAARSPRSRHLFKAFDGLTPNDVRVVVLGQDPYPVEARATGRAFEPGDIESFDAPEVADSLQRLLCRMIRADLAIEAPSVQIYKSLLAAAKRTHDLSSPALVFDHLADQGVLFLNASLTIPSDGGRDSKRYLPHHQSFWRPFTSAVLGHLNALERPPVFLLMGKPAQRAFKRATGHRGAEFKHVVESPHPVQFKPEDEVCRDVNTCLEALGRVAVRWLPAHR